MGEITSAVCVLRKTSNEALIILFRAFNPKIQTDKYAVDDRAFYRIRRIQYSINSARRWHEIKLHLDSLNNVRFASIIHRAERDSHIHVL